MAIPANRSESGEEDRCVARGLGIPIAWGVSAALLAFIAPGFLILQRRLQPALDEFRGAARLQELAAPPASHKLG